MKQRDVQGAGWQALIRWSCGLLSRICYNASEVTARPTFSVVAIMQQLLQHVFGLLRCLSEVGVLQSCHENICHSTNEMAA
jgi:hypothetical protein